jgi:hypothetical protein
MLLEVASTTATSLISTKQCHKVICRTTKFSLFKILSEGEQKVTVTTTSSTQALSIQQKQVKKIVEENKYIFASPTGVSQHYRVQQSNELVPDAPLPNGPIYRRSLPENENLTYVQHSSIGHDPFQVCLGFQPLTPIDITILSTSSPTESSHTQTKADHVTKFVEGI